MSEVIKKTRTFFFDRDSSDNVFDNGSGFTVEFEPALFIPADAKNCQLYTTATTIWNVIYNIDNKNNLLRIEGVLNDLYNPAYNAITNPNPGSYDISVDLLIPPGIYSAETISGTIWTLYHDALATQKNFLIAYEAPWFKFVPDESTGEIVLTGTLEYNKNRFQFGQGIVFRFDFANSPYEILGFDNVSLLFPQQNSPAISYIRSPNIAVFNNADTIIIQCPELAGNGIPINGQFVGAIARIPIGQGTGGSILQYEPTHPYIMNGVHLVGQEITQVTCRLLLQNGESIQMREDWSFALNIEFY